MAVATQCPGCRKAYWVSEDCLGRKLRCPNCGQTFTVEMAVDETIALRPEEGKTAEQPSLTPVIATPPMRPQTGSGVIPDLGFMPFPQSPNNPRRSAPTSSAGNWARAEWVWSGSPTIRPSSATWPSRSCRRNMPATHCIRSGSSAKRAAAKLNHPNTVTIYQVGTDGPLVYLAMELVEGVSLDELASRQADGLAAGDASGSRRGRRIGRRPRDRPGSS